jgi:hypothetical protein
MQKLDLFQKKAMYECLLQFSILMEIEPFPDQFLLILKVRKEIRVLKEKMERKVSREK